MIDIEKINTIIDAIQKSVWLLGVIYVIYILMCNFNIVKKTHSLTKLSINRLEKDGKYIPNIFVELNDNKEILRYFIYGEKWKKRIINAFNYVYDNEQGKILKRAVDDTTILFYLFDAVCSIKDIGNYINKAIDLHENLRNRRIKLKSEYEQEQIIYEIMSYFYVENLKLLQQYSQSALARYFVLTGSAGNGKTNLLCSISMLLMNLNEAVLFLNAKDIIEAPLEYVINKLMLHNVCKKYIRYYLFLVNLLLILRHKHLFIIIDAINENENKAFGNQIAKFINDILVYSRFKVIVSCRSEYYTERYKKYLIDMINNSTFEFDLKEQEYTAAALDRVIQSYSRYFEYSGNISLAVRDLLQKQLLLLRLFFEVYQKSTQDVLSLRKHEIFALYMHKIKEETECDVDRVLTMIANIMLTNNRFDYINIDELREVSVDERTLRKIVDSSILINKKLIAHEGTIARNETEAVYFVFDEMRDYCLARRILLDHISRDTVDCNAIIEKIEKLVATKASCAEGVVNYVYIFFRTSKEVEKLGITAKLCNSILNIYRLPDDIEKESYRFGRVTTEFRNLGMKIILTSGLQLTDFEILYIQDCLTKAPYNDSWILFITMLNGTLYDGVSDLNTYIDIVLGMDDKDAMSDVLASVIYASATIEKFNILDFIQIYKNLITNNRKKALQIHKLIELILISFKFNNEYMHVEKILKNFFYNLSEHYVVQREMLMRLKNNIL